MSNPVLIPKTIEANNVYDPADDNADGYSQVIVNVNDETNYGWFSENGTYYPESGIGYYYVDVDVEGEAVSLNIKQGTALSDITKITCPNVNVVDADMDVWVNHTLLNGWQVAVYSGTMDDTSGSYMGGGYIMQGGTVRPNQVWIESFNIDPTTQYATVVANFNTTGYDYVVPYGDCQLPADHLVPGTSNHYHYDSGEWIIGTIPVYIPQLYNSETGEYYGDPTHQMKLYQE